ncbi:hypothetical protein MY04_4390 [Flammeovirga sp. MY04]|uniref:hypothetical protein n=1 Tax=Flammeovirga sp. MY04 TaxID=1191459 RepID=UPI0008060994|nr:hypothetical protein [Flammeovirga sp. MY04]ANQ51728.1 hypothetical protein MY04_4390 [Flammeovirga sp. MY04]
MKKTIFFLFLSLLFSCSVKSIILSETERKGVDDIVNFYGGYCESTIGKSVANGEASITYFEVKLKESEGVEQFKKDSKFASSNMAYRLYRNLTEEEKAKYTEIRTAIVFENGITKEYTFKPEELAVVDNKSKTVDLVVDYIKDKNFNKLSSLLNDSSAIQYDKAELIHQIETGETTFGKITEEGFRIFGYRKVKFNRKFKKYLMISGVIVRDGKSNEFSVVMDPKLETNEVLGLEYKM